MDYPYTDSNRDCTHRPGRIPIAPGRSRTAGPVIVTLSGDINAHDMPALRRRIASFSSTDTVVDAGRLGFCSAAGLEFLMHWSRQLAEHGNRLVLAGASPALAGVIARLGLGAALPCVSTIEAAAVVLRARRISAAAVPHDSAHYNPTETW
ncbi:STAS domain-containing protein [Tomitella gaofuii]|uniref:STAS domain-containing protein n=1 Tax=Tomitella gaofuii TaxID=2760083 RepID=UPI0015FB8AAB|nr:STAS domain-containing protein [Tomitella gaofuii]